MNLVNLDPSNGGRVTDNDNGGLGYVAGIMVALNPVRNENGISNRLLII